MGERGQVPVVGQVYVSDGDRCEVVAVEPHRVRVTWTWRDGGTITAWMGAGLWSRREGWTIAPVSPSAHSTDTAA